MNRCQLSSAFHFTFFFKADSFACGMIQYFLRKQLTEDIYCSILENPTELLSFQPIDGGTNISLIRLQHILILLQELR